MGKRGPKPTPTKEKQRLGNPGKRPINGNEPEPTGQPEPPDYLDKYARAVWGRILLAMDNRLYTACDTEILAAYCRAASLLRSAAYVNSHGRFQAYQDGYITQGQYAETDSLDWIRIEKNQSNLLATTGTRLGLDPAARASIKVPEKKPAGKFGEYGVVQGGRK